MTGTDFSRILVQQDHERDIAFTGKKIASASSSPERSHHNFSGDTGRWTVFNLYRSQGGKSICECIQRTQWQGERDSYSALVCDTEEEVVEFFGCSDLAKSIYADAGISAAVEVA